MTSELVRRVLAGLAVFLYLQDLERGQVTPTPAHDKCEQLTPPAGR